ncbi:MAG: hypothetical protein MK226_23945 [Saprospiraceae bacterium]|nr:hypothetical protein [Saprospiraceae bacterium]
MSSTVNRYIRVFPIKDELNESDIQEIGKVIVSNSHYLENRLEYSISKDFADLIFTDEDGEHFKGLDFDKYVFWELSGSSFGNPDWIRKVDKTDQKNIKDAIYQFDRIVIVRKNSLPEQFRINGKYTACKCFPIGQNESTIPTKVSEFNLLEYSLSTDNSGIISIEVQEKKHQYLVDFISSIGTVGSTVSKTDDLIEVSFLFNNRVIRTYKWIDDSPNKLEEHRYGYWECRSADFWDNCDIGETDFVN